MRTEGQPDERRAAIRATVILAALGLGLLVSSLMLSRHAGSDLATSSGASLLARGALVAFCAAVAVLAVSGLLGPRYAARPGLVWTLVAMTVLSLAVGLLVKAPCLTSGPSPFGHADWDTGQQYSLRCYDDVSVLYGWRSLDHQYMPYVPHLVNGAPALNPDTDRTPAGFLEYPVVTGMLAWIESGFARSGPGLALVNAVAMTAAALGTTLLLVRFGGPKRRLLWWAAGPPLALYAFHNFDLLAVLLATAGMYAFHRGRPLASGALLGLGAAAKIYPGILVPVLLCELLRRRDWRAVERLGAGAVAAFIAVNLPFAVWDAGHPVAGAPAGNLWLMTYTFHLDRTITFETPWYALTQGIHWHLFGFHVDWTPTFATSNWLFFHAAQTAIPFLVGGILAACAAVGAGKMRWMHGCLAAILVFLLLNKVYSLQYSLWVMPLVALLELPWWAPALYVAADAFVFWTIWPYFASFPAGTAFPPFQLAVFARSTAIAVLLFVAVRAGWIRKVAKPAGEAAVAVVPDAPPMPVDPAGPPPASPAP